MRIRFIHAVLCQLAWLPVFAQEPLVTATRMVDFGGGKQHAVRQINGRWWTPDNREIYPPGKGGFFWEISSKPGVVDFYHHRPADLRRAESLRLFMGPNEVEALLGPPNTIFAMRSRESGHWHYYGEDGTKLSVWLMDGELGDANYERPRERSTRVAAIDRELAGRSIFSIRAKRAGDRVAQGSGRRSNAKMVAPDVEAAIANAVSSSGPSAYVKRIVSAEALAAVTAGTSREDLVKRLGEPSARAAITDDDGVRETLTYHLESGGEVRVRVVSGRVKAVER